MPNSPLKISRFRRVTGRVAASILAIVLFLPSISVAGMLEWNASSGLRPDQDGWNIVDNMNPPATISFDGDAMFLSSTTQNRNFWRQEITFEPLLVTGGGKITTEVQVLSATRERPNRALNLLGVGEASGGVGSIVDVYATTDTVFLVDTQQQVVDEFSFDTSDTFHTYRGEIFEGEFKLFIDGDLVSTVDVGTVALGGDGFGGSFGDGSNASANNSLWRSAKLEPLFEFEAEEGSTEENPILPTELPPDISDELAQAIEDGGFYFGSAPSGVWFDPVVASGYDFQMFDNSLFLSATLPAGFLEPFSISSNGQFLGDFLGGETVNFGTGVSSFSVTDIRPLVDPTDPQAFPIFLEFDSSFATFTMTPTGVVPEPSSIALLSIGGIALVGYGWRRKRQQAA